MKYNQAKAEFQHILDNQKTVEVTKLKGLMQSLNMTLERSENKEINYLKNEIRKIKKTMGAR